MEGPTPLPWITLPLALVAGLAVCFAMPPWGWWPLALVGIALWAHLLDGHRARDRFFIGWAVGVGSFRALHPLDVGPDPTRLPVRGGLRLGPDGGPSRPRLPRDRRRLLVLPRR